MIINESEKMVKKKKIKITNKSLKIIHSFDETWKKRCAVCLKKRILYAFGGIYLQTICIDV